MSWSVLSCWRTRAARGLVLLAGIGATLGLLAACPGEPTACEEDEDCPDAPERAQCDTLRQVCVSLVCTESRTCPRSPVVMACDEEEGLCVPIEPTEADSCTDDDDCGDRAVCVDERCAVAPSCQKIYGAFEVAARCPTAGLLGGTAMADTTNCLVDFTGSLGGDAFSVGYGSIPADAPAAQTELTLTDCTGEGSWSAAESAGVLEACAVAGETCDVAVVSERLGAEPCFVDLGCETGTCQPLASLDDVGVCR